ncbi:MAG: hypothetical protein P1U75_11725 [Antarcticimicrobium sp.]|uniref:Flp family type IVb pilin n=1 Tax=Antarcticimicrobium sp. TaxID=2824147 RepID=UPI00260363CE|nr:hypothetical protein [Antarcticimicrobium sp.]MDF1717322.1 hypothetical protein [Antarcticimicrobium sp.]
MFKVIKRLARDERGAVTVDWVVLTAAVVALCGLAIAALQEASGGLGENVGEYLADKEFE